MQYLRAFACLCICFSLNSPSRALAQFARPLDVDYFQSDEIYHPFSCKKANAAQISELNRGGAKLTSFSARCKAETSDSPWCDQVVRPNPASISVFRCTYGETQAHLMIHPDERTWPHAFKAVQLIQELEAQGINVCLVYNWWRPEPYNANVGGVPGRHPRGTSVDVRLCSMTDMEKAFLQLCAWRKQGRLKAVGYYGTTALHFGIGDSLGNTWGKNCPAQVLEQFASR